MCAPVVMASLSCALVTDRVRRVVCCCVVSRAGMAIPCLPEKKVIGNKGAEFVEERMRGLSSFMINIIQNPYLRHDHTLNFFLTVEETGAGEWEQTKKVRLLCACACVARRRRLRVADHLHRASNDVTVHRRLSRC
jgi:hypothetical protein